MINEPSDSFEPAFFERLQSIGLSAALWQRWIAELPPGSDPASALQQAARVIEVQRDSLTLHDGACECPARMLPALANDLAARAEALAVGDWVLAECNDHGQWWATKRLPPASEIARRLHDGRDKVARVVIVSNVDTALLVMGLDNDYNLRRLERYLALARLAGIGAVVVLTKADLCGEAAARQREVQALVAVDVAVVALNVLVDEPRMLLAPWLGAGQTLVLLGSSGVGKSTLTNALLGADVQAVGGNRRGDDRGRHTTTARSLHRTAGGACIIDTPGLRTLRLDGNPDAVAQVFDDIAALAPTCRFRDCRHDNEPGCAVREGVAPERLRSFQKLLREARRDTLTALQRREQLAGWKARTQAARANLKAKRG